MQSRYYASIDALSRSHSLKRAIGSPFGPAVGLNCFYLLITLILYTSRTITIAIAIQAVRV